MAIVRWAGQSCWQGIGKSNYPRARHLGAFGRPLFFGNYVGKCRKPLSERTPAA